MLEPLDTDEFKRRLRKISKTFDRMKVCSHLPHAVEQLVVGQQQQADPPVLVGDVDEVRPHETPAVGAELESRVGEGAVAVEFLFVAAPTATYVRTR